MAFFENARSGFYRCSGSVFFFKKNVGFSNMEEQLTKSSWRKPRQKGIMDVKTGVKHFTNPVNHEKQCFLYFAKTIFN
tara:strand:- start:117 stop:350 length:234 start_codon:yes stop_codon:yes gene_type:complete